MPLPVIPDNFQVVMDWNNPTVPRNASTTLHFEDTVGTQTEANLFADFEANVTAAMWTSMHADTVCTSVRITRLNGITAGVTFPVTAAAKWKGTGTGSPMPQMAHVISLKSQRRGSRGRNRIFLPFIAEDRNDSGVVPTAIVSSMTTAWQTFQTAMAAAGFQLVAVSGLYNESNWVTAPIARPFLNTQRRRARR